MRLIPRWKFNFWFFQFPYHFQSLSIRSSTSHPWNDARIAQHSRLLLSADESRLIFNAPEARILTLTKSVKSNHSWAMTNENESSPAWSITMYVTDDSICRSNNTTRGKLSCHSLYPVYHIWKKNCFPFSRHGLFSSNQLLLLLVFSPPLSRSHFSRRIFFFSPSLLCGHPSSNVSPLQRWS